MQAYQPIQLVALNYPQLEKCGVLIILKVLWVCKRLAKRAEASVAWAERACCGLWIRRQSSSGRS
jgi:hypothetical protein